MLEKIGPETADDALPGKLRDHCLSVWEGLHEILAQEIKLGISPSDLDVATFQGLDGAVPYYVGTDAGESGDEDVLVHRGGSRPAGQC